MKNARAIRILSAVTAANGDPSASTVGIAVPQSSAGRKRGCHLQVEMGAASGTRTYQVALWGYRTFMDDGTTKVASSDAWFMLYKSPVESAAADFNEAYYLEGCTDYDRLYLEVVSIGGTTPTLTAAVALEG